MLLQQLAACAPSLPHDWYTAAVYPVTAAGCLAGRCVGVSWLAVRRGVVELLSRDSIKDHLQACHVLGLAVISLRAPLNLLKKTFQGALNC